MPVQDSYRERSCEPRHYPGSSAASMGSCLIFLLLALNVWLLEPLTMEPGHVYIPLFWDTEFLTSLGSQGSRRKEFSKAKKIVRDEGYVHILKEKKKDTYTLEVSKGKLS